MWIDNNDVAFFVAVLGLLAFSLAPYRAWASLTRSDR